MGHDFIYSKMIQAEAEVEKLKTRLSGVLELHYAKMDSCESCGGHWPCLTYKRALGLDNSHQNSDN